MSTVSPTTNSATNTTSTAQAQQTETTETEDSNANGLIDSDFQTFLVMLTTQLENQDPLNPMEASEFAVQLATFSGVEQQVKSNDLLEGIQSQLGQMSMTQLAGWVGMEARVQAPVYVDGEAITIDPDPHPATDRMELVV